MCHVLSVDLRNYRFCVFTQSAFSVSVPWGQLNCEMLSKAALVFLVILKLQSDCMDVYIISVLFNFPIKKLKSGDENGLHKNFKRRLQPTSPFSTLLICHQSERHAGLQKPGAHLYQVMIITKCKEK